MTSSLCRASVRLRDCKRGGAEHVLGMGKTDRVAFCCQIDPCSGGAGAAPLSSAPHHQRHFRIPPAPCSSTPWRNEGDQTNLRGTIRLNIAKISLLGGDLYTFFFVPESNFTFCEERYFFGGSLKHLPPGRCAGTSWRHDPLLCAIRTRVVAPRRSGGAPRLASLPHPPFDTFSLSSMPGIHQLHRGAWRDIWRRGGKWRGEAESRQPLQPSPSPLLDPYNLPLVMPSS